MQLRSAYDRDVRDFTAPVPTSEPLTCQFLVIGGGFSGLSAAEAAMGRGVDTIVIEKGLYGHEAASGLNAGQFLTGWAKPVSVMLKELTEQESKAGLKPDAAHTKASRRLNAFLTRTAEGCLRLVDLDQRYNLRASVQQGAIMAGVTDADVASLQHSYSYMDQHGLRMLMPRGEGKRRRPSYQPLTAHELQARCGTGKSVYAGGVIDRLGGSFNPRKLLNGLARRLQNKGVRFYQETEATLLDANEDGSVTVICDNGASIRAQRVFMANAYARAINGDIEERSIFCYDYVTEIDLPTGSMVLPNELVISDTREPCFYARREGNTLYMGHEETAETSDNITQDVALRTLAESQRIFPGLRDASPKDIKSAWAGAIRYTVVDYPFLEQRGQLAVFAAPGDHGNAIALRVGEIVGHRAADLILQPHLDEALKEKARTHRYFKLFASFPQGRRLRPGMRYAAAAHG